MISFCKPADYFLIELKPKLPNIMLLASKECSCQVCEYNTRKRLALSFLLSFLSTQESVSFRAFMSCRYWAQALMHIEVVSA